MPTSKVRRVDDVRDDEGFIIEGGYTAWNCEAKTIIGRVCGVEIRRYRGQGDAECPECGACYNASGQRLRDDWRRNRSNYDDSVGDMEGFEAQYANDY